MTRPPLDALPALIRRHWPWLLPVIVLILLYRTWLQSMPLPPQGMRLKVARGGSWSAVADQLADDGLITSSYSLRVYLWLRPGAKVLRSGVFILRPPMTMEQLVQRLAQAPDGTPPLVLIEGERFQDLRVKLNARTDIRHDSLKLTDAQLMAAVGGGDLSPEGEFAPDTYVVEDGDRDIDILRQMYLRQQRILADEWTLRAPDLPYKTPYEALIMASLVEKETGVAEERPQIAGVFIRRLALGMRLQTDPTIIYGLGAAYHGNLTHENMRVDTPYNTYRHEGLPPTPIAMPGRASINAALHPDASKTLYFVANGKGRHVFSATLEEHNHAVDLYQR